MFPNTGSADAKRPPNIKIGGTENTTPRKAASTGRDARWPLRSFQFISLKTRRNGEKLALVAAITLPNPYSKKPASRTFLPCARRMSRDIIMPRANKFSDFRTSESLQINPKKKMAAGRRSQ
jgi:hypothetical protein